MAHAVHDRAKLIARVRRIVGQMQAVERTLDGDGACADVLRLVASARGAMNGLMAEILVEHMREHGLTDDPADADAVADVVRMVLR